MLAEAALALGVWLQLAAGQEAPGRGECPRSRVPTAAPRPSWVETEPKLRRCLSWVVIRLGGYTWRLLCWRRDGMRESCSKIAALERKLISLVSSSGKEAGSEGGGVQCNCVASPDPSVPMHGAPRVREVKAVTDPVPLLLLSTSSL